MALKVSHANNVSIYHCTSGRTLPQWEEAVAKKEVTGSLRYNESYRRRLELLQDFEFKASSGRIHVSDDRLHIGVSGMYGPTVKVFQVEQLGMKFERHLDAEVVQFRFLTPSFRKMAFLRADRTLELHAQYGKHVTVRIPKFGRDLLYDAATCDLYVAAAGADVYRLNLEQGRFLAPFASTAGEERPGSNCLAQSAAHPLLAVGCEDGRVQCWDPRDRSSVCVLDVPATAAEPHAPAWEDVEVTALSFSLDGLTLATGLSNGRVALYDLRAPRPTVVKDHRYGLPVLKVEWAETGGQRLVVSTDAKSVRLWSRVDGAAYTAIESATALHDSTLWPGSGLVMATGEAQRVQVWYVPALGPAPSWCAFLDSLTEELEEAAETSVYDDYQFVTREQLSDWGCDHLIGTGLLRAYMHGFFMHSRLHAKLSAAHAEATQHSAPAESTPAQLQRLREKTGDRILQRRAGVLPVNARYAEELMEQARVKRRMREEEGDEGKEAVLRNPLLDDRFAQLFKDEEFKIDEQSDEYRRLHPSHPGHAKGRKREREEEKRPAADTEEDDRFERLDDEDDEEHGRPAQASLYDDAEDADESDDSAAEDEEKVAPLSRKRKSRDDDPDAGARTKPKRAPAMFGLKQGVALPSVLSSNPASSAIPAAVRREMSLAERLTMLKADPESNSRKRGRVEEGVEDDRGRRGRGRGRGRSSGGFDGGRPGRGREDRRGMTELLGPDRPAVARGKWAERGRGRGRGRGFRGGRGGSRGHR